MLGFTPTIDELIDFIYSPNVIYQKPQEMKGEPNCFMHYNFINHYTQPTRYGTLFYSNIEDIGDWLIHIINNEGINTQEKYCIGHTISNKLFKTVEEVFNYLPDSEQHIWRDGMLYWTRRFYLSQKYNLRINRLEGDTQCITYGVKNLHLNDEIPLLNSYSTSNLRWLWTGKGRWYAKNNKLILPDSSEFSEILKRGLLDGLLVGLTEIEKWEKYYEAKNRIDQMEPIVFAPKEYVPKKAHIQIPLTLMLMDELPRDILLLIMTWSGRLNIRDLYNGCESAYSRDKNARLRPTRSGDI